MGNLCCCPAESPCGSAEERSGLLNDESRVTGNAGGPQGGDCKRKTADEANNSKAEAVQVKPSPENGEAEPNNTQENGPLQKEGTKTAAHSPEDKGLKLKDKNSTRAQDHEEDVKVTPAEPPQCTLNLLQEPMNAAVPVGGEKTPDVLTQAAKVKHPSNATPTRENVTLDSGHVDDKEEEEDDAAGSGVKSGDVTAAEPSGEVSQNNEALSVPNTQLATDAAAAAACQVSSVHAVSQEVNAQARCAASEDSASPSVCQEEANPEHTKNHHDDGSESGPGSATSGLNDSGEVKDSASSITEPETADPSDASESSKSNQDEKLDAECSPTSSEIITQDNGEGSALEVQKKDGNVPEEKEVIKEVKEEEEEEKKKEEEEVEADKDAEVQEEQQQKESESESTDVKVDERPVTEKEEEREKEEEKEKEKEKEKEESSEGGLGNSEEDLYRGAEELSASQAHKAGPPTTTAPLETTLEDRCSLAPAVDILSYSEREWKGNTAKSALIRKGYKEMSQRFGSVRRVRGDNYCALRATLFQVLSHSARLPAWLQEDDITVLPTEQEELISQWIFPGECLQGERDATTTTTTSSDVKTQQLKGYMERLRDTWRAAVDCGSAAERQQLCERVFQGGEEELGLLEALKLLMLSRAVELHGFMKADGDVPLFCWLLFARDSSDCPRAFLSNHLSHVGLSAGLEQVEMFLLGYALRCTIQVYRLYKADTEEFVTFYPDDHKDDWPSVCLVTEDDRHYNVPVGEAAAGQPEKEEEKEEEEEEEEKEEKEEEEEGKVASS